ncbi:MAG: formate/nitrite transporter family protein [Candidatus Caldatribacteriota bacterium]|nr:formate/nitrite transporter family protein [Atribacterota bacterium]MDD3031367.1 formate/nitrite transporter family protein [Atribacterota bacterium]MDD3640852.1 formate/nitrite transporter family protein [Atribacterota bacterium]MDD4288367.1 formate/nitrite transporter family protein [Atribacterota bacterium]MDD4764688.1 formate/nitrite transporter family protein [Atribacterota bacterium]
MSAEKETIQKVENITAPCNAPAAVANAFCGIGKNKADLPWMKMIILGILAGAYIGFGAQLATMVTYDSASYIGDGISKILFGSVFSVGLMLVVIAGAELFTGNNLIVVGTLNGNVSTGKLLNSWFWIYVANFIGSILLVWIMYATQLWKTGDFAVGAKALSIASGKVNLSWGAALARGIVCNWLVCLAVWLAVAAKDVAGKILAIYFPIMAFVASGFEHSIANMYFVPMGIMLKGNAAVVAAAGLTDKIANLTWGSFILNNLVPVTIGNIIGGAFFVATLYWYVYLRKE